ncbi:protein phosphatase 1 regulatory subunit 35 [Oryzias melastigma]|uniref:protein phosphatase 1 regulatory subunit 35 n=1 Tax=Oryzias melastigma TaxID=30732 RepID=UPI000CF82A3E|nr:protein phosphatase 1 regulatory subunit 35 [Oryzias melastigma]XP_024127327.1 protein phosphatase 1 regulatory subunit 35 [Oryzias melastigma]
MSFLDLLSPPQSPSPAPLPLPSSSIICCPELDLSVTSSPAPNLLHTKMKPRSDCSQGAPGRRKTSKVTFVEPAVVEGSQKPSVTAAQQSGRRQRRIKGRHHALRPSPEPSATNQDPSCLERAELNTTLALKAELQSLKEAEFNSQRALQETLQKSERTKNLINARATEVVNISRSQLLFNSLVSVEVQQEQLLSQVLKERLQLTPTASCQHSFKEDRPTLLFFKTSHLVQQKPLPPEEGLFNGKQLPSPRPIWFTFDLYRRQRCWEAAP